MFDEILQKLLESELLSEDSKADIKAKFEAFITEAKEAARQSIEAEVRSQLTEEFVVAREELVESVNSKINAYLEEEMAELHADIDSFRDLEVEAAAKLAEAKEELAIQLGSEIDTLVDKVDAFLEVRVSEEFAELAEDLEAVKKDSFGRKIFGAFAEEFSRSHIAPAASLEKKVAELEDKLADAESMISEMETAGRKAERSKKLDELLAPLSGSKKEHMRILLANVETMKLSEAYNRYIDRVLKEATPTAAAPIVEEVVTAPAPVATKVVTGNEDVSSLNEEQDAEAKARIARMKLLAGL